MKDTNVPNIINIDGEAVESLTRQFICVMKLSPEAVRIPALREVTRSWLEEYGDSDSNIDIAHDAYLTALSVQDPGRLEEVSTRANPACNQTVGMNLGAAINPDATSPAPTKPQDNSQRALKKDSPSSLLATKRRPLFRAEYLLHPLVKPEDRQGVYGDLLEKYEKARKQFGPQLERYGHRQAARAFYRQVIRSFFPLLKERITEWLWYLLGKFKGRGL